jgi:predicted Fe-S protein YdhL (DUF1289 family)
MRFFDSAKAILSPCVGICALDAHGVCAGCHRTTDEIARWMYYTDAERSHLMNEVLPQRAAQESCK